MIAKKWSGAVKMLLKIQEYCVSREDCIKPHECPFMGEHYCRFFTEPSEWELDDWKEDFSDESNR